MALVVLYGRYVKHDRMICFYFITENGRIKYPGQIVIRP